MVNQEGLQSPIMDLTDTLGNITESFLLFFANLSYGWISILAVITIAFIVAIYMNFFARASRGLV